MKKTYAMVLNPGSPSPSRPAGLLDFYSTLKLTILTFSRQGQHRTRLGGPVASLRRSFLSLEPSFPIHVLLSASCDDGYKPGKHIDRRTSPWGPTLS